MVVPLSWSGRVSRPESPLPLQRHRRSATCSVLGSRRIVEPCDVAQPRLSLRDRRDSGDSLKGTFRKFRLFRHSTYSSSEKCRSILPASVYCLRLVGAVHGFVVVHCLSVSAAVTTLPCRHYTALSLTPLLPCRYLLLISPTSLSHLASFLFTN